MTPTAALARFGGIARTADIAADGVGRAALERALSQGEIVRVKRGWVAARGVDPHLNAAERCGVVLTCITQAQRLGLWVLEHDRPHVAARSHSGRAPLATATVHWARPVVPRHPDVHEDSIENVLAAVSRCQPFETALAVWESALNRRLVDVSSLARLPLPPAARALLDAADPYADSGLETFAVLRLRWLGVPLRRQIWLLGHRVDLLIGDRLALQIDGGHHVGAQRESDIAHDAALMLAGFHVIRVGYWRLTEQWPEVQDQIMRAVAQGLHRA